jgi:mannose-P-dolichol utilization defect protein 1
LQHTQPPNLLRSARRTNGCSVRGLSLTSFISELSAYLIAVAYNARFGYAFSTWGDTLMSALQHSMLVALVFHYDTRVRTLAKVACVAAFAGAIAFLFSDACSLATLRLLQASCIALLALGGRLPQIVLNVRRGNSGELSIFSCGLSVAGTLARVFTTLTLVGDPIILATAMSQLVLNSVLLWQTLDTARQLRTSVAGAAAG